ncbi:ABC transporter ATP-binding protein [Sphingobacterium spiritivorum]|uniref:ABC transporter ATP-binding protein n=1 Tax=Sphingobacterium spiritivorum TaxID=258 RepID=UPI001918CEFE|nr:ABC transporter ATP-binding protein [Sphingobacterium spiritivorum]QQT25877.1 ABC transporter ATP-binding protein [Sphingobacterium spiritivorum]
MISTGLIGYIKWASSFAKSQRWQLLLFFCLELCAIFLSLLFVYWSKKAVDLVINKDTEVWKPALVFAVGSVLLGLLTRLYADWLNEKVRARMLIEIQNKIIKSQMMAVWKYVMRWSTGDIQVRIHSDCQEIVQMVGYSFLSCILTVIRLFAAFGFLWLMDPMLAILILAISPLFLFSKVYFRRLRALNARQKQTESELGHVVQENIRFRTSIRALGMQTVRWNKVQRSQDKIYSLKLQLLNFSTFSQAVLKTTINAGFLITFVWGIYQLHTAQISFGTMTAFLQLVGRIQSPIVSLMSFIPRFIRFRTATDRVQELLEVETEEETDAEYISQPESVSLEKVEFRYEDQLIINKLCVQIKAGKPVAIVGTSGKGKTTFIRLLLALIQPDSGEIRIHTAHSSYLLTNRHRVNMAYVPQGDKLFSTTIRENLITGTEEITAAQIHKALYLACAEFIYELPDGLDTVIGESGYGLSEGQAQRIAIARAMMGASGIWLFDEITSALDGEIAQKVFSRLTEEGKDKIMVFVTHDLKLAQQCDQQIYI